MNSHSPHRQLRALGISESAEAAYVALLRDGEKPAEREAEELRKFGLLFRADDADVPVSIDGVLSAWSSARAAEESATKAAAAGLQEMFDHYADRTSPPSVVRLIRGRQEVMDASDQFRRAAIMSMDELVRPPFLEGPDAGIPEEQADTSARGVQYRAVYESKLLSRPSVVAAVNESVALGELARAATDLPLRLAIADRSRAMVVLPHPSASGNELLADDSDALIVESSSMLDALVRLFDQVWQQAVPLNNIQASTPARDAELELLLSLLSVGMTDAAIAQTLGVSERTVLRRISALSSRYGVSSRFQLGAALAQRGLLPGGLAGNAAV